MDFRTLHIQRYLLLASLVLAMVFAVSVRPAAAFEASYLYNLANFTGTVTSLGGAVAVDDQHNEVYAADNGSRGVRVFNQAGMEVYRFGDDTRLGSIRALTVLPDGDILMLSSATAFAQPDLLYCNYRGEPKRRIPLKGLPGAWRSFQPDIMVRRGEHLYLADRGNMLVVEAGMQGGVVAHWDLGKVVDLDARDAGLGGFTVDAQGRLIFTLPVRFKVCILAPDGSLDTFGKAGSIPGLFGVVAGVDVDAQGHIFVVDTLRCKVIAFGADRDHPFLGELGGRGYRPGGLIAPVGVKISASGRLFVSQMSSRGVVVYRLG